MKITKHGIVTALGLVGSTSAVAAQTATGNQSTLLPPAIQSLFDLLGVDGRGLADFITTKVQTAIYLILGAIILVAVIYAIMAGIKYIRSEGDPGKIEEATKSIKAILMGIAAIFIGILGIILVYVIFNQNPTTPGLPQVCVSAGSSVGCKEYNKNGINDKTVQWCEGVYRAAAAKDANGDPIFKGNIASSANLKGIAAAAVATGGVDPTTITVDAYDFTTNALVSKPYTSETAIKLCVDPLQGGYSSIQQ